MQALPAVLQELTSKGNSEGVTGARWTLLSPNTSVNEDRRTRRGGNVMFSDYLYAIHMQTYSDCSFSSLISIHSSGVTLISVLLHRDLSYHCTIQSDSSIPSPSLVTS